MNEITYLLAYVSLITGFYIVLLGSISLRLENYKWLKRCDILASVITALFIAFGLAIIVFDEVNELLKTSTEAGWTMLAVGTGIYFSLRVKKVPN